MVQPFIGSEAVRSGALTAHSLRTRFRAVYPNVYLPTGSEMTAITRARAAWLWSGRCGIVAGRSASALHGAKWIEGRLPAQLLWENRHRPRGVETWSDSIADDEVTMIDGIPTTTPARTALDLACRLPRDRAVAEIDALCRASRLETADVEVLAGRYRGRRGIRRVIGTIALVDAGAESPRETWLRLLLIRDGLPPPTTQLPVRDEYGELVAVLDMGWENLKIAAEYDGDHHRTDRHQFNKDIRRVEILQALGWLLIRVTAMDTGGDVLRRVRAAFARRG